jgi:hypothetical protein
MIATETARTIFLVFLGLSLIWVIACIVRNDMQTIIRAIIVLIIVGLGFFYLNQTKLTTISFKAVKNDLFPPKTEYYSYEKRVSTVDYVQQTSYAFAEPSPRFVLDMEEGGKYLSVKDLDPLNRVLQYVGLPPVKHGVRELASITGSNHDVNMYRWDDYDLGTLTIERGICHNARSIETFPCIVNITVRSR